jgi:hypothetical protein
MLDRNSNKTLKMLNSLADEYAIIANHNLIANNMPNGYNTTTLISNLEYLKKLDYLDFASNLCGEITFLQLHHKGLNYKKITWLEIRYFVVRSILVPIGVSFITNLFMRWLF